MRRVCPYCKGRKTERYRGNSVKCVCSLGHGPERGPCIVHVPPGWFAKHSPDGRPKWRSECVAGPRPCPHVWTCPYHLYAERLDDRRAKIYFPHLRIRQLRETCALDVAGRGSATLEQVGDYLNLTRERVRQIELSAITKLRVLGRHWR